MSIGDKQHEISLIEASINGDGKAQKKIYNQHVETMYAICLRYLSNQDDAKDALQNGFIKAFKNLNKFKFQGSFEGWLKRIFVNCSIELIRKRKFHTDVNEMHDSNLPMQKPEGSEMDYNTILSVVDKLPTGYKTVFNMYVVDGFSHQEIAKELGISESTSKTQLFKARKQLQSVLKNWFDHK